MANGFVVPEPITYLLVPTYENINHSSVMFRVFLLAKIEHGPKNNIGSKVP